MTTKPDQQSVSFRRGEWAAQKSIALMKQRIEQCEHHACEATMRRQLAEMEDDLRRILGTREDSSSAMPSPGNRGDLRLAIGDSHVPT
jgi:hypothetical protein